MKQHHHSPTAEALCRAQQQLIDEIYAHARRLGLSNDELWPIPDGIYVPEPKAGTEAADLSTLEAYLSGTRVMWVLKEPYDETEGNSPSGGGWNLFGAFDNDDAWANRTWQSSSTPCTACSPENTGRKWTGFGTTSRWHKY